MNAIARMLFTFPVRRHSAPPPRVRIKHRLNVESLEDRTVPSRPLPYPVIFAGVGQGPPPLVRAFDAESGTQLFERVVADQSFTGGVRLANADVTLDKYQDLVVALGPGGAPHVQVLDGKTGNAVPGKLGGFHAYGQSFRGGLVVAAADVNGDGVADVITGAGAGGGPHIQAFSGTDGSLLRSFFAFESDFRGGVTIAAADFNGDGKSELAVGAGTGGGPRVRVFDMTTGQQLAGPLGSFFAFETSFKGGVSVGTDWKAADVTGDEIPDLVVGTGPGIASRVKVYSGANAAVVHDFAPFAASMTAGVTVATCFADDDAFADVVVGTGQGVPGTIRVYSGETGALVDLPTSEFQPFGPLMLGGVNLAATNDPPLPPSPPPPGSPPAPPPTVTVEVLQSGEEPGTPALVRFTRTGEPSALSRVLTVAFDVGGTATPDADYTALPSSIVFYPGVTEYDLPVWVTDDLEGEGTETVSVEVTENLNYVKGDPGSGVVSITDDERVTVSIERFQDGAEPGTSGVFRLTRAGTPAQLASALSVGYSVSGSATEGADYNTLAHTTTFSPNQTTSDVAVSVLSDELVEDSEDIVVALTWSDDYHVGAAGEAELRVFDAGGSIGGITWADDDADGYQDAGEQGFEGVSVVLRADGEMVRSALTGESGSYLFTNLVTGDYTVEYILPAGKALSSPATGSSTVHVGAVGSQSSASAGVTTAGGTGSIGGDVWYESDLDGNQESGETAANGIRVELVNADGGRTISTTTTDSSGHYNFPGLDAGSYVVRVVPPLGFNFGVPSTGRVAVTLAEGQQVQSADVNLDDCTASPSITLDEPTVNGASVKGKGTYDLAGGTFVSIHLFAAAVSGQVYSKSVTTAPAGGNWELTIADLPKGKYNVYAVLTEGPNNRTYLSNKSYKIEITVGDPSTLGGGVAWWAFGGMPTVTALPNIKSVVQGTVIVFVPTGYTFEDAKAFITPEAGGAPTTLRLVRDPRNNQSLLYRTRSQNAGAPGGVEDWDIAFSPAGTKYRIYATVVFKHNAGGASITYQTDVVVVTSR